MCDSILILTTASWTFGTADFVAHLSSAQCKLLEYLNIRSCRALYTCKLFSVYTAVADFGPIFLKLAQNICLDDISIKFDHAVFAFKP